MRYLFLAILLAFVSQAGPASAQGYYRIPPGGYEAPPQYAPPPPGYGRPRYYDEEDNRPRRRTYREEGYGGGYGSRRGSSICVTSRGNCPVGAVVPPQSPCRCDIPGFGPKRGATAY